MLSSATPAPVHLLVLDSSIYHLSVWQSISVLWVPLTLSVFSIKCWNVAQNCNQFVSWKFPTMLEFSSSHCRPLIPNSDIHRQASFAAASNTRWSGVRSRMTSSHLLGMTSLVLLCIVTSVAVLCAMSSLQWLVSSCRTTPLHLTWWWVSLSWWHSVHPMQNTWCAAPHFPCYSPGWAVKADVAFRTVWSTCQFHRSFLSSMIPRYFNSVFQPISSHSSWEFLDREVWFSKASLFFAQLNCGDSI